MSEQPITQELDFHYKLYLILVRMELHFLATTLVTGVDDFGTMNARSQGWAYFTIPETSLGAFSTSAAEILGKSKLAAFHGKEFKRRFEGSYLDFLTLIKETLRASSGSSISATLLDETWKSEYLPFCRRVISGALLSAGIDNESVTQASVALAGPLFTFQRLAGNLNTEAMVRFEIDSHAVTEILPDVRLDVRGHAVDPATPIFACYNAYRNARFPHAPLLQNGGVQVKRDEESFLIQAADLFANFSVAYTFQKLGKVSKTTARKAEIFSDCFGNLLPNVDFDSNVETVDEDLVLKQHGVWTLHID